MQKTSCLVFLALALTAAAKLNVHVIPHTHDDVGWLKTVDQYFYGANNSIQIASVSLILDSVIAELVANPARKFIYCEQAFFQRWWAEQGEAVRDTTRRLVANHQLEFVNGGWTQHDEANPYYVDMIDQTTLGHRFLLEQFNYVPRIGWQIDPFGHSATQPTLLGAEVGFDALYFSRIDYQDLDQRRSERTAEMVWSPSKSLGGGSALFTGVFVCGSYGPPHDLSWDVRQWDDPVMDDACLQGDNTQYLVDRFVETAEEYGQWTQGSHVMFLMGSDFHYSNARLWYQNLDKIIDLVNADGRVTAFYSNPIIYTDAKAAENLTWPVKDDDFFPICQNETEASGRRGHAYWSGFFTSRPLLKYYSRRQSARLQAARQLQLLAALPLKGFIDGDVAGCKKYAKHWNASSDLFPLELALGELTHHDGITGTSKQHVVYDYAQRLSVGASIADGVVNAALAKLSGAPPAQLPSASHPSASHSSMLAPPPFVTCNQLNISVCPATMDGVFKVSLYNPLPRSRYAHVRLPLSSSVDAVVITDMSSGARVPCDVVRGKNQNELLFVMQMCGLCTYVLDVNATAASDEPFAAPADAADAPVGSGDVVLENEFLVVTFDSSSGRLSRVVNKEDGVDVEVDQGMYWYEGDDTPGKGAGAYMFRPRNCNEDASNISCVGSGGACTAELKFINTSSAQIAIQTFSPWASQVTRLWQDARFLEIEFTVGPIPIDDGIGKEVVSRFTSRIQSKGSWTTDANGYELQRRQRNYRKYFDLNLTEPQAANYYPVGSVLSINDVHAQLSVVPDRAQGGTSLIDGQAEFLIHRRLLADDGEGVGEPLNETTGITPYPDPQRIGDGIVVRGSHFVHISQPSTASKAFRATQHAVYNEVVLAFAPHAPSWPMPAPDARSSPFPENVGLLTLQHFKQGVVLLRIQHLFGVDEDALLSQVVQQRVAATRARCLARVQ